MFIFSMQPDNLAHDADEDSVTRSLEAYLLWLFGYIMFNNSHGAYVDRVLVPYAQEIAEAAVEEMPQYSWGAAVLAATYRGLCKASVQNKQMRTISKEYEYEKYKLAIHTHTQMRTK